MANLPLGLLDPVDDAQAVFRAALRALSLPGEAVACPAPGQAVVGLMPATAALLLALTDQQTPVWWNHEGPQRWLRFHTGAPTADAPGKAHFGVVCAVGASVPLTRFDAGSDEQPDRSATVLIELPALTTGPAVEWSGPGLREPALRHLAGLPTGFWPLWAENHARFPRGVDILFVCGHRIVGLPRTTRALEWKAG